MTAQNDGADGQANAATNDSAAIVVAQADAGQAAPERAEPEIKADPLLMDTIIASAGPPDHAVILVEESPKEE